MTKEEATKYLQQLYPNGGHCWLDEQRIEAIGMAINALQEEPVSEQNLSNVERTGKNWKEPVSDDLEEAAKRYATEGDETSGLYIIDEEVEAFKAGAKWQKEQMMEKGIETTFNVSLPSVLYDKLWVKGCKEGDKLLVIKKDEL